MLTWHRRGRCVLTCFEQGHGHWKLGIMYGVVSDVVSMDVTPRKLSGSQGFNYRNSVQKSKVFNDAGINITHLIF